MARIWHHRQHVSRRLRLRGYDYSIPGGYSITLCAEHRLCLFGDVVAETMMLITAGLVMESWWCSIPNRFPSAELDEFIVMPNHFHGILFLGTTLQSDDAQRVTLSDVVRWFEGNTTRDYNRGVQTDGWQRFPGRLWQESFFEHILRNDDALARHRAYIEANPSQWAQDEENPNRAR